VHWLLSCRSKAGDEVPVAVEIGYGIDPAYRNRGYMTEAVRGLIDWAFRDPRCRSITAPNTERSNIASNHVKFSALPSGQNY
jgi:ribosomal-protein-alanine N-acetyltransferase